MHRVVIHLVGGDFSNAFFVTKEDAWTFIQKWIDWIEQKKERVEGHELVVLSTMNGDNKGHWEGVWLAAGVIGMYLAQNQPTPQDRMAAALEKHLGEGEEWKGE